MSERKELKEFRDTMLRLLCCICVAFGWFVGTVATLFRIPVTVQALLLALSLMGLFVMLRKKEE